MDSSFDISDSMSSRRKRRSVTGLSAAPKYGCVEACSYSSAVKPPMNTSTPQHTRTSAPRITRLRTCASCARTSSQKYRNWNPSTTVSTCGPRRTTGHPRAAQRGPRTTARSSSSTAAIRCAERVARTVKEATGRQTIILREQASLGRTLIEKFEHNAAKVSYAIVVLTPDDEGGRKDQG